MLKPQYYAKSRSDARRKDLLVVPSCVCVCVRDNVQWFPVI